MTRMISRTYEQCIMTPTTDDGKNVKRTVTWSVFGVTKISCLTYIR